MMYAYYSCSTLVCRVETFLLNVSSWSPSTVDVCFRLYKEKQVPCKTVRTNNCEYWISLVSKPSNSFQHFTCFNVFHMKCWQTWEGLGTRLHWISEELACSLSTVNLSKFSWLNANCLCSFIVCSSRATVEFSSSTVCCFLSSSWLLWARN